MLIKDLQAPIYLIGYIAARSVQFTFSAKENHTPGAARSYGVFPAVGNNSRTWIFKKLGALSFTGTS